VGHARFECRFQIGGLEICSGYFDIEGRGQIVSEGVFTANEERAHDLAITGGTDAFTNVRGQAKVGFANSYDGTITFELIP
jgi:hypothetical protein